MNNTSENYIWLFHGAGGRFASGVFSSKEEALIQPYKVPTWDSIPADADMVALVGPSVELPEVARKTLTSFVKDHGMDFSI